MMMNLFATHPSPDLAARDLDDSRLGKMQIETAQLICSALRKRFEIEGPYRSTHIHHPISKWLVVSAGNMLWTLDYGFFLNQEWIKRRGKPHGSGTVLVQLWKQHLLFLSTLKEEKTDFHNSARSLPHYDFTHLPVHEAYRTYLNAKWQYDKRRPRWTNAQPPAWWDGAEWKGKRDEQP